MNEGPPRSSRAEAKERTRERLLDAAATEFASEGYGGARVEVIAERAGVTTGALYGHFGSKAGLFAALYDRSAERTIDAAAEVAPPPDGDLIGRVSDEWLERHRSDPRWFQLAFTLMVHPGAWPEARNDLLARREEDAERLAQVVAIACAERGYEPDVPVEEMALVLRALANGFLLEELSRADSARDPTVGGPVPSALPPGIFGRWVNRLLDTTREQS